MKISRPFRRLLLAAALAAAGAPSLQAQQQRPVLSPRDTVRATLAQGATVLLDYGRPSMRGRRIMGELVPFGRVWRTGANAATTLVASSDLRIGDAVVPRGTYTLFTVPGEREWLLIVNRQTGQWGTQYDASRDLVRVPMQTATLERPVEQLTLRVEPASGATPARLVLEWENTRAWVPLRPAPAREGGRGR